MSASVRISAKAARDILRWRPDSGDSAFRELEAAIAKASRASATRRTLRKPREAKRQAKREARQEVRALVVKRADGLCEVCGMSPWPHGDLDHFFGVARAESVETCWFVCRSCHDRKHAGDPSAAYWASRFATHCHKHGYTRAEKRALQRLSWVEARGAP